MEKENIKPTAMEIAHKHMDLKDILRKKIIDFSIIKGQEIGKIFHTDIKQEQEIRTNKKKELTQGFREENKILLDEYKDVGSKNRWNQGRFEFTTRILQKLKITDLSMDEFRKVIGFENINIPRYVWDKQALESKGINIEEGLASLTPRESEIMNIYFEGGDMKLLAEKNNLSEQRVRQIRKKAFRRLRARAGKNSEK